MENVNVQEIFNKVIQAGHYDENAPLMCYSLLTSFKSEVINLKEYRACVEEIKKYLGGFGSLGGFLDYKSLPCNFNARLSVYKDWVNKP